MKSVAVSREKVIHYFQNVLTSNVFSLTSLIYVSKYGRRK